MFGVCSLRGFPASVITAVFSHKRVFLVSIFDVSLAYRGGGGIGCLKGISGPYTVSSWLSVYANMFDAATFDADILDAGGAGNFSFETQYWLASLYLNELEFSSQIRA
jgi:hypothetical protein